MRLASKPADAPPPSHCMDCGAAEGKPHYSNCATLEQDWPEARADAIGQNGNDGAHYATSAAEILRAGLGHMEDRAATYDKPAGERSMAATVRAFAATTGIELTEEQGWHFMALLKLVRSQQGGLRMDSYEDGAAYFGLMGEAAAKERA